MLYALPSPTARRICVEAAQQKSFARAASTLDVTQAAVSKQIAPLERRIGSTLLERQRRPVRLTSSGEAYLPVAEHVLLLLETGRVDAASRADRDALTVVIDHEFLDFGIVPRRVQMRADIPLGDVRFAPEMGRRISPNCDLAITFGHLGDRGLQSEKLYGFIVFAVGAPTLGQSCAAPQHQLDLPHNVDTYWWTSILRAENISWEGTEPLSSERRNPTHGLILSRRKRTATG